MRDALDQATGELPSIDPPPPSPRPRIDREPKTNVTERKRAANYTPPKQIESCRRCKHMRAKTHDADTPFEHETHGCSRNHFGVQLGAICDHYAKRRA